MTAIITKTRNLLSAVDINSQIVLQEILQHLEFLRQLEAGEIELDRADEDNVVQDYVVRSKNRTSYGTSWFEAWKALQ